MSNLNSRGSGSDTYVNYGRLYVEGHIRSGDKVSAYEGCLDVNSCAEAAVDTCVGLEQWRLGLKAQEVLSSSGNVEVCPWNLDADFEDVLPSHLESENVCGSMFGGSGTEREHSTKG